MEPEFRGIELAAKQLCLPDAAVALLRLEDVYHDWRASEYRRLLYPAENTDQDEDQATVYFRRAQYLLRMLNWAFSILLDNGKECGRKVKQFPHIYDFISPTFDSKGTVLRLAGEGKIDPRTDAWFVSSVNAIGTFPLTEVILLEGGSGTKAEQVMGDLLNWTKRLLVYATKMRAVRLGKEMKFVDTPTGKMLVTEAEKGEEDILAILMKEKATPRHLVETAWQPNSWVSDFHEVAAKNHRDIDSQRDPKTNLEFVTREEEETTKAYASFDGFSELFLQETGFSFESHSKVCVSIARLVMGCDQHVFYGDREHLSLAVAKDSGLDMKEVKKLLDAMTWKVGEIPALYAIYPSGLDRYTSYRRVTLYRQIKLEMLFFEKYTDNDLKGRVFEERCRELLRKGGFRVYPDRVIVPFQIVPSDISNELWNKVKSETDFDVVARVGNLGFLLECKEVKVPSDWLVKQTHRFEKYTVELYHKTLWVKDNREAFRGLLKDDPGLLDGVSHLVPLVVTTFPFDVTTDKIALITLSELDRAAKRASEIKVRRIGEEDYASLPWRGEDAMVETLALPLSANEGSAPSG